MANDSDSLPPSWILTTKLEKKNGSRKRVMCYRNVKTGHCFNTRKELDRYVEYVKRELPLLYAVWANKCTGKEGGYCSVKRNKGKGKKVSNGSIKKKEVAETNCTPRVSHTSPEHQPVIYDGPFRRPKDKEKVVCTTSSIATTRLSESYHLVMAKTLPRKENLALSVTRGKKSGADGASSSGQVLLPGGSFLRPAARYREQGWL